jgi:hypothetical protein
LKPPQHPGHAEERPSALGATTRAQHEAHPTPCATKFAQQRHPSGVFAKKLAQQAQKRQFWSVLSVLGELYRV